MMVRLQSVVRALVVAGVSLVAVLSATAWPAAAQSTDVRDLIAKIQRLERALSTLERYVYAGWKQPAGGETTPARQGAETAPAQVARVQVRLTELETELRNLTGRIEELGFKIDKVHNRVNKLVEDVDFRLTALERDVARSLEVTAQEPASAAVPRPAPGEAPGAQAPGGLPGSAPGPQMLGTITAADLAAGAEAVAAVRPEPTRILPEGTTEQRYEFAKRLLRQGDWADAEAAFREFVTAHPEHQLAANGQYWLGETFYVRKDYGTAAAIFLEGYQRFPTGPKAPGTLLKLGMSLANMELTEEACQTFAEVLEKHAEAPASIMRLVEKERQRVGCL